MTEEQIERRVERGFDALDAEYLAGNLTTEEYDAKSLALSDWADRQYRKAIRSNEGW